MTRSIRVGNVAAALVLTAVLVSCAPSITPSTGTAAASPTPTAACPAVEGVEVPPDCAPYDPQKSMDLNERHRDRMGTDSGARESSLGVVETVRAELELLRGAGDVSVESVTQVFLDAGLEAPQVRDDYGDVLFGGSGLEGGCIFGEVSDEGGVVVEFGGYILDGGCLPSQ